MYLEVISSELSGQAKPTPILFIHGAWHGAWCWGENFLPFFAEKGYSAHALSLRGHGSSEGNLKTASLDDYIADVLQIANQFNTHPILIGHSMGGYVIQHYLQRYADNVPAAVLVASIPINGIAPMNLRLIANFPKIAFRVIRNLDTYEMIRSPQTTKALFFSSDFPPHQLENYHAQMQSESLRILFDATIRPPAPMSHPCPMLVLGAIHDRIFTREEIRMTARAYGTEAEFFNMAHNMMLEPGWIAVAGRIAAWLDDI